MWKRETFCTSAIILAYCFSPLAGISYVETYNYNFSPEIRLDVSVPLRGLVMWKLPGASRVMETYRWTVSVPLRGLVMWKPLMFDEGSVGGLVSVPLRGLVMWKHTLSESIFYDTKRGFSPLAGISYVETTIRPYKAVRFTGFSPLAGISYVET